MEFLQKFGGGGFGESGGNSNGGNKPEMEQGSSGGHDVGENWKEFALVSAMTTFSGSVGDAVFHYAEFGNNWQHMILRMNVSENTILLERGGGPENNVVILDSNLKITNCKLSRNWVWVNVDGKSHMLKFLDSDKASTAFHMIDGLMSLTKQ